MFIMKTCSLYNILTFLLIFFKVNDHVYGLWTVLYFVVWKFQQKYFIKPKQYSDKIPSTKSTTYKKRIKKFRFDSIETKGQRKNIEVEKKQVAIM